MYGQSEFLFITTGADEHDEFIPGNLGRLTNGTQLKIVDVATKQKLGPNSEGEICVRGNTVFSGYYNKERESSEVFDDEGWLRTGDVGHYDDKHRLFITDRIKEFIYVGDKYSSTHISASDLEQYLLQNDAIADVMVVGVNNVAGGQWPRAYVVVKVGHTISGAEVELYVSGINNHIYY